MKKVISFGEAYPLLKALYDEVFDDYAGNFGPDAFAVIQKDKKIPPKPVKINIAASAGDFDVIEPLEQFEDKSREFGRTLARKLKDCSIDAIVSTGGCQYIGQWTTEEISYHNPEVILVALMPTINGRPFDPGNMPRHLKHYDIVVNTGMNRLLRSILVGGLGEVLFVLHGGYGSAIENATAADSGLVVSHFDIGSQRGVSRYGPNFLKNISYQRNKAVFLASPDAGELVDRSLVENLIMSEGLRNALTSAVLYHRIKPNGEQRILANIRRARQPATFYHQEDGLSPIDQSLIVLPQDEVFQLVRDLNGAEPTKVLDTRPFEEPVMLKLPIHNRDYGLDLADKVRREIANRGARIVYSSKY